MAGCLLCCYQLQGEQGHLHLGRLGGGVYGARGFYGDHDHHPVQSLRRGHQDRGREGGEEHERLLGHPRRVARCAEELDVPGVHLQRSRHSAPAPERVKAVLRRRQDVQGRDAQDARKRQRDARRHDSGISGKVPEGERDARLHPKEPGGVPGDKAHGFPEVLFPLQRRAARDSGRDQERASRAAAHVQVLRWYQVPRLWRGPQERGHLRHVQCGGGAGAARKKFEGSWQRRAVAHSRGGCHGRRAQKAGQGVVRELCQGGADRLGAQPARADCDHGRADLLVPRRHRVP
mmetsp:Transcript_13458/g.52760  ORF Transcript_13458/g.52760 Transcript_13458/m.52760 type:complete len:290 (+) Transcript_13458:1955-2824(+)